MEAIPMRVRVPRFEARCFRLLLVFCCITFFSFFYFCPELRLELVYRTTKLRANVYFNTATKEVPQGSHVDYLVWSPSCHIPDMEPWHDSIKQLTTRLEPVVCSSLPPLSKVKRRTLNIVQDHVMLYAPDNNLQCCYQVLRRQDDTVLRRYSDNVYSMSQCKPITASVNLTSEQQFIMIQCTAPELWGEKVVYTNFHARVPIRKGIRRKLRKKPSVRPKMSVLIVGLDSISRLNLIRTMPKTVGFLRKMGWVEMKGYNKINDNTFPNLMAILTGLSFSKVRNTCMKTRATPLDNCPFIWKNFSDQGYITGYGEDTPEIGTFNFAKAGFFKTPTDYYLRPFMLAAERNTKVVETDGMRSCLGPKLATDHVFKYALDFATTFRNHLSFSLFWMNSLSHNSVNTASAMELQTLGFLQGLRNNQVLNNSLVIFLSDHGTRFGKIRETHIGWLEERLPFLFIWVPEWYRKLNPQKYSDLLDNRGKLTSPFDLHLTLQEVLYGKHEKGTPSCPDCVSMLDKVPWDRSCFDAGIPEHWCTCSQFRLLSTENDTIRQTVKFTIDKINTHLYQGGEYINISYNCAKLSVNRILSAHSIVHNHKSYVNDYIVVFETLPGQALFEATVRHSGQFKLLGTVSRINAFGSQSLCMNEASLKKYCFCVETTLQQSNT